MRLPTGTSASTSCGATCSDYDKPHVQTSAQRPLRAPTCDAWEERGSPHIQQTNRIHFMASLPTHIRRKPAAFRNSLRKGRSAVAREKPLTVHFQTLELFKRLATRRIIRLSAFAN